MYCDSIIIKKMGLKTDFTMKEHVLVVRLSGELDHHEAEILREIWQQKLRDENVRDVILNLEEMIFMDSSGIDVLLGRNKEISQAGDDLVICKVNPSLKKIFDMSGLFKIIRLEDNEQYALHSLGVAS